MRARLRLNPGNCPRSQSSRSSGRRASAFVVILVACVDLTNCASINTPSDVSYARHRRYAPLIASFTANPTSLNSGAPSMLSWATNGAATISISPIGFSSSSVSGAIKVSPTNTTTYRLTAADASGSSTATATVTVTAGGGPPVAPIATDPLGSSYLPPVDTNCEDYPSNVWVTGPLYKLRQDSGTAGPCPGIDGNKWGTFYGTQNEFIDFQVHLHDTGSGAANFNVTVSNFVQTSPGSYTIPSSTAAVPFNVIVYREAYQDVTNATATGVTFYGSSGFYPDILIPAVDPYYDQTTNAFPFTIAANQNQSVWIDVHVPSAALSGYYSGTVTVKSGSTTLATLPVTLAIWQWPSAGAMPSTSSLPSYENSGTEDLCIQYYGGYTGCSAFPEARSSDGGISLTTQQLSVLMLDHRRDFSGTYSPVDSSFTTWETYFKPLLNGTNPSSLSPMLAGAKSNSIRFSPITGNTNPYIQNWLTEFKNNSWYSATDPLFYVVDEPGANCTSWTTFTNVASIAHGDIPPGQMLITGTIANANTCSATSSVDIFVPNITDLDGIGGSLNRSTYNTWLAGGSNRRLWSYQSCSSTGTCSDGTGGGTTYTFPNIDVDGVPVANRAFEWLTFLHTQTGELYYDATFCWRQSCGYPTTNADPWNSVYAFGGNGDGTTVYPSTAYNGTSNVNHITQSGGSALTTPIVVPSIRLKLLRDGMQDYEYMNALTNNGKSSLVTSEINCWITNSYTFNVNPVAPSDGFTCDLNDARLAMGNALHSLSY